MIGEVTMPAGQFAVLAVMAAASGVIWFRRWLAEQTAAPEPVEPDAKPAKTYAMYDSLVAADDAFERNLPRSERSDG